MRGLKFLIAFVLLLGSFSLQAQHYLGVRGGYTGGMIRLKPLGNRDPGLQWGLYSAGISWKHYSETKIVGGLQADLQYTGRGFMYDTRAGGDTSYHRTLNTIELPVMWQPHFYMIQRKARVFMNLGVNFSYTMNSRHWYESTAQGVFNDAPYQMRLTRDNRFGYGLVGGFGVSVLTGRWDITLEGRYTLGFSDVLRNTDKYETNPRRSPVDQINISIGGYYRLGKGGILAPPSPRMERQMAETEARRILRRREKGKEPTLEEISPLDSILRRGEIDSALLRQIDSLLALPVRGVPPELIEPEPATETEPASGPTHKAEPAAGEEAPKPEIPAEGASKSNEVLKPETPAEEPPEFYEAPKSETP